MAAFQARYNFDAGQMVPSLLIELSRTIPPLTAGLLLIPLSKRSKRPVGISWRMDETYIKAKGQ